MRLVYCNTLYRGLRKGLISRLQVTQNAGSMLVLKIPKRTLVRAGLASPLAPGPGQDPIQASMSSLLVQDRMQFKLACLAFKCLLGLAPGYPDGQGCSLPANEISTLRCPQDGSYSTFYHTVMGRLKIRRYSGEGLGFIASRSQRDH